LAAVAFAVVAACGGTSATSVKASPTVTAADVATAVPQPPPGSDTFLQDFRRTGLGNRDLSATTDDDLLAIGRSVCNGLNQGLVPEQVESVLQRQPDDPPTSEQAHTIVVSARRNLCPAT
jgi:hypothetical protein